jgi:A/G-specific adenine glycosylase
MLQQTTVAAVRPRFERFIARWPTVEALSAARDEDILGEWAGLGYYARARNLIACARTVAAAGGFPADSLGLRQLPGIGVYTAAAIAAIAFGERATAVDTNIRRVLSRFYALADPSLANIEKLFLDWLPERRPGDMVQAMMDLGATICTARAPRCAACPLMGDCSAAARGEPEAFPLKRAKPDKPSRFGVAWWIEREGSIWLVRRPPTGLLGGMAALPGGEWTDGRANFGATLATARHVFTHFALELAIVGRQEPTAEGWWQPLDRIGDAGLPTLYKKAVEAVLATRAGIAGGAACERLEEAPSEP